MVGMRDREGKGRKEGEGRGGGKALTVLHITFYPQSAHVHILWFSVDINV